MIIELIYFSKVAPGVTSNDVSNIFRTATKKNEQNGVTGVLYSDGKYFIQIIEGLRHVVSSTYSNISVDKRHRNLNIVRVQSINERRYAQWSMAVIRRDAVLNEIILDITGEKKLDPYVLSCEKIINMTHKFSDERLQKTISSFKFNRNVDNISEAGSHN